MKDFFPKKPPADDEHSILLLNEETVWLQDWLSRDAESFKYRGWPLPFPDELVSVQIWPSNENHFTYVNS